MHWNPSTRAQWAIAFLALLAAMSATPLTASVPEARPIVLSGQHAAGTTTANYSAIFGSSAMVNDHGQVAFTATMSGSGVNSANNMGLWLGDSPATNTLIARLGDRPPGLPVGARFSDWGFGPPQLNNRGEVAFSSPIQPAVQPIESGAWTTAGGPLRLLAADRYPLPGAPGSPIVGRGVYGPMISDSGQTSFVTTFGTNTTLWVDTPGGPLRRVVSTGDNLPPGVRLPVSQVFPGLIDANGHVIVDAQVTVGSSNYLGLWSETSGSLQPVVIQDLYSGGIPDAHSINNATISPNGLLSFDVFPTSGPRLLVAQNPDSSLRVVASTQQTAPGTTSTFSNLYASQINALGQVAFVANFSGDPFGGPIPTSIWAENATGLHMMTRAGDPAPGASGAIFEGFEHVQFNDFGDLLFEAYLTQGVAGVSSSNDQGLWLHHRNGVLTLIAREGDQLDIAPGPATDLRSIFYLDSISSISGLPNQRRMLNNRGEVLFYAEFNNGTSGLFLTGQVPEPSTLTIALIALLSTVNSRRPRRRKEPSGSPRR
jgi:hypothetical protein